MKNILLVAKSFAPRNNIAAIRFTKVVKYMALKGSYRFWVVTLTPDDNIDAILQKDIDMVRDYVEIQYISVNKKTLKSIVEKGNMNRQTEGKEDGRQKDSLYYKVQTNLVNSKQKGPVGYCKRKLGNCILSLKGIYNLYYELNFARKSKQVISNWQKQIRFDVMITTYGQIGNTFAGLMVKKKQSDIGWIVDYRDPIRSSSRIVKKILFRTSERADTQADFITGASRSYIGSGKWMQKHSVITNGFDRQDINGFSPQLKCEKLVLAYVGTIYYGKQDMSVLFQILSELREEKYIDLDKIIIEYAGKYFNILEKQARQYGMEKIVHDNGMLPREKSLKLQEHADVLILLTWNNIDDYDVIPGKTFEYMMINKPIIGIATGDKEGSAVKKIIEECQLGICYEEACREKDYKSIKRWICDKYREKINNTYVSYEGKIEEIEKYSYENIANRFAELVDCL